MFANLRKRRPIGSMRTGPLEFEQMCHAPTHEIRDSDC
jgi:hypothetical protein